MGNTRAKTQITILLHYVLVGPGNSSGFVLGDEVATTSHATAKPDRIRDSERVTGDYW